jgi:hypothetical protein
MYPKMKSHLFYIILCCLLVIDSCGKKKDNLNGQLIDNFPPIVKLKGIRIFKKEIGLRSIAKTDTLFVVGTNRDTIFHIYNQAHHIIARFGRKGRGPNEFSSPPIILQTMRINSHIEMFYESTLRRWSSILG